MTEGREMGEGMGQDGGTREKDKKRRTGTRKAAKGKDELPRQVGAGARPSAEHLTYVTSSAPDNPILVL